MITGYISVFAFGRFVYKLYVFGHNLDPDAPLKIPPFTPAIFGTKQIANFVTHSYPAVGGLFIFAYALKTGIPLGLGLLGMPVDLPWPIEALLQAIVLLPAFGLPYAVAVRHVFSPRTVLRRGLQYALARARQGGRQAPPVLDDRVLDADALNAIARRREWLQRLSSHHVLTPHAGEAARLLGWGNDAGRVNAARHSAVSQLCTVTRAAAVLKGADTLVAQRGAPTTTNVTGNAGLAKAGSGDVLSGIIGALLARGMRTLDAAVAGAWIHGRAADMLAAETGEDSYISSDLARALGGAFSDYQRAALAA